MLPITQPNRGVRPSSRRRLGLARSVHRPQLSWVPPGRALHLTDVENLMGGPGAGAAAMAASHTGYLALAPVQQDDHVIAACNPWLGVAAAQVWRPGQLLVRHGKDGADLALLGAADPGDIARRFYRVVIGSGDAAFTALAVELGARGLDVQVVARPEALARSLARAAKIISPLRLPQHDQAASEANGPQAA